MRWSASLLCLSEFGDGVIKLHRMGFDRPTVHKRAAKGWLLKKIMSSIVGRTEEGQRWTLEDR